MKERPINECPVPKGILMSVGGHEKRDPKKTDRENNGEANDISVLKTFYSLVNKENPVLIVITTASSEGDSLFKEYHSAFNALGVSKIVHMHHHNREEVLSDIEQCLAKIEEADAIFFSGGDQLKLTSIYGGTSFLLKMKQRYIHEPLVIGGTSAGAMALSTPMIYAGNKEKQQISGEIKITTGLEFLKDACIDTHFVDRSRFVRMAQVLASNPSCLGIGIEEDTAVIIRNGIEAEVCGNGVAIVTDGRSIYNSTITEFGNGNKISVRGLKVDILSNGDTFIIPQTNPPHI